MTILPVGNLPDTLQSQSFKAKLHILQCEVKWVPENNRSLHFFANYSILFRLGGKRAHIYNKWCKWGFKVDLIKQIQPKS